MPLFFKNEASKVYIKNSKSSMKKSQEPIFKSNAKLGWEVNLEMFKEH